MPPPTLHTLFTVTLNQGSIHWNIQTIQEKHASFSVITPFPQSEKDAVLKDFDSGGSDVDYKGETGQLPARLVNGNAEVMQKKIMKETVLSVMITSLSSLPSTVDKDNPSYERVQGPSCRWKGSKHIHVSCVTKPLDSNDFCTNPHHICQHSLEILSRTGVDGRVSVPTYPSGAPHLPPGELFHYGVSCFISA